MKRIRLYSAAGAVLLATFLTVLGAFAQGQAVDRAAYVSSAYEGFYGTLFVLSGSDSFLNSLTPQERAQFSTLGNAIFKRSVRFAPPITPGSDRTSIHSDVKLRFSSRREDFIILPDQVERTAKMDGDIWFNLNKINDPKIEFGPLEAYQILFHEFGHVLGEEKDQALIDQVAAKMKCYLKSYYSEQEVAPGLKIKSLVLPYLTVLGGPVDFQPEPIVVFDLNGHAKIAQVTGLQFLSAGEGFQPTEPSLHAYTRLDLKPTFSAYKDNQILAKWSVESKHILIDAPVRSNFLELYSNSFKAVSAEALAPVLTSKTIYQLIDAQTVIKENVFKLKNHAVNPEHFKTDFSSKWIETLKVKETREGLIHLEGVIETPDVVAEVALSVQKMTTAMNIPGVIEKIADAQYRIAFSIPDSNAEAAKLVVTGISMNSQKQLQLAEVLQLPTRRSDSTSRELSLSKLDLWNGSAWVPVEQISTVDMPTPDVRFRFQFQNAIDDLNHIEGFWIFQDEIKRGEKVSGSRFRKVHEVIPKSDLRQTLKNGTLTVEFESKKMSNYLPIEAGKFGVSTADSGYRGIERIQFFDTQLRSTNLGTRMVKAVWSSAFNLKKPRTNVTHQSCQAVFSQAP